MGTVRSKLQYAVNHRRKTRRLKIQGHFAYIVPAARNANEPKVGKPHNQWLQQYGCSTTGQEDFSQHAADAATPQPLNRRDIAADQSSSALKEADLTTRQGRTRSG